MKFFRERVKAKFKQPKTSKAQDVLNQDDKDKRLAGL